MSRWATSIQARSLCGGSAPGPKRTPRAPREKKLTATMDMTYLRRHGPGEGWVCGTRSLETYRDCSI